MALPLKFARGRASGLRVVFGRALIALGAVVYAWCIWNFATLGRGTPAPIDPPRRLVVRGPYRYSRNPMYLGVLGVIFGWSILRRGLLPYLGAVCVIFNLFIRLYEEPHLTKIFGQDYTAYCESVPRWIIK